MNHIIATHANVRPGDQLYMPPTGLPWKVIGKDDEGLTIVDGKQKRRRLKRELVDEGRFRILNCPSMVVRKS